MLCAYYDCSCDSHALFAKRQIAKSEDYKKHLNQYMVIDLDITGFISLARKQNKELRNLPELIESIIREELISIYPYLDREKPLMDCMIRCIEKEEKKFVFIIDECDAVIREAKDDESAQVAYLDLLRSWFKNDSFPSEY